MGGLGMSVLPLSCPVQCGLWVRGLPPPPPDTEVLTEHREAGECDQERATCKQHRCCSSASTALADMQAHTNHLAGPRLDARMRWKLSAVWDPTPGMWWPCANLHARTLRNHMTGPELGSLP